MIFLALLCSLSIALDIQPWPLPNEKERQELTQLYLKEHYNGSTDEPLPSSTQMTPKMIVIHWTGASTAKSTWNTFASAYLSGRRDIQKAGSLNVSAHFLVDRDGTVYQLLPSDRIARHCIGLNHLSIGIENVGGGDKYPLTEEQAQANIALIEYLTKEYPITHVIGHYEASAMEKHPYFSEKNPKYRSIKPDPGKDFMRLIRMGLHQQNLSIEGVDQWEDQSK